MDDPFEGRLRGHRAAGSGDVRREHLGPCRVAVRMRAEPIQS